MDDRQFYQERIYGYWRDKETVSYRIEEEGQITILVEKDGKQVSFSIQIFLPEKEDRKRERCPFFVCMHPIQPKEYALSKGYAVIFLHTLSIAGDDNRHQGVFYDLYPYGSKKEEQTGVLMAWAWGASKVLDAVKAGLGEELGLDEHAAIVTGVSRWGKATAVCGAFDERFKMVVPTCSGAGGLALYGVTSQGKTYDLEAVGGPKEYTYGENEPLSCLQSEGEQGWFCDAFLEYQSPKEITPDQENLVKMAAGPERYYFILAACMGEDWVNAPSMWECYRRAREYYRERGLTDHLAVHFHKEGHAVIEEDMELLIAYFEHMVYQKPLEISLLSLQTTVFEGQEK